MNILKLAVSAARNMLAVAGQNLTPTRRVNWVGPRFEPVNISATATVQDIQRAIRLGESGDTAALFRFYRDCLLGDDHVQGELNKRKLAVIGQPLAVLPAEKESEDDTAAAAACLRAIRDCENWNTGMGALLGATQWPVVVAENIFRTADEQPVPYVVGKGKRELRLQYTLKRIEPVNPMLFCFLHAYQAGEPQGLNRGKRPIGGAGWQTIDLDDWEPLLRLWPIDGEGRIEYDTSRATKLDPDRHVVHRGHLLTDHRDNWGGPFRAILFWWLLRGLGRDWFGRFMERYGSPFPVGKTNVQDKEAVALLEQAFSLATKIGGLVIGQEDQVELQQAVVQGGAEGHKIWHDTCNNAISRHITGYGTNEKPAGLNTGEESLVQGVRSDLRIFDTKLLAETLEKQLFARLLRFNGLAGNVRVVIGGLSASDGKLFAEMLKTARDAGWEPTDGAMPVVQEKLGIEVQRAAPPAVGLDGFPIPRQNTPAASADDDEIETLSVMRHGKLIMFTAGSDSPLTQHAARSRSPIDPVVAARIAALSAAYHGAMSPFRQVVLTSDSRESCLKRLELLYSDWDPGRLATELDHALQICSATAVAKSGV